MEGGTGFQCCNHSAIFFLLPDQNSIVVILVGNCTHAIDAAATVIVIQSLRAKTP